MGSVVFTLVLDFRAAFACAHFHSACVNRFPRVHLCVGGASRVAESVHSLGASATGLGSGG